MKFSNKTDEIIKLVVEIFSYIYNLEIAMYNKDLIV